MSHPTIHIENYLDSQRRAVQVQGMQIILSAASTTVMRGYV